uniref:CCHC-type domain-containing protein n=1 Tax=Solanum lycopersicum TaxID=4081 RepID=A0A3Q7HGA5_SOLLC
MSLRLFDIGKFDRKTSFTLWKIKMHAVLVQNSLHKPLTGEKPIDMKADQWKEIDEQARSLIYLYLADEILRQVIEEKTAKQVWDKLEALHLENIRVNKLLKKHCLYSLRMKKGTTTASVTSHINDFESIVTDLENLDEKIDDETKALLLLRTLPCSYEDFVDEIVDGKDAISFDEVKSSLLKISSTESSSRSRNGDVVCWNCGKIGHVSRNCDYSNSKTDS